LEIGYCQIFAGGSVRPVWLHRRKSDGSETQCRCSLNRWLDRTVVRGTLTLTSDWAGGGASLQEADREVVGGA